MQHPSKTLETSAQALVDTFSFGPDCSIHGTHTHTAHAELINQVGKSASSLRVAAVNDKRVMDTGDLQEALIQSQATNPGKPLRITLERTDVQGTAIAIEQSVMFDGNVSLVAAANKEAIASLKEVVAPPEAGEVEAGSPSIGISSDSSFQRVSMYSRADSECVAGNADDTSSPYLLEFDKMKVSSSYESSNKTMPSSTTVKGRLLTAMSKITPGRCVICVTHGINPVAELELMAMNAKKRICTIDVAMKLRLRPKPQELASAFAEAMRSGAWFVLANAHKSISTCRIFDELLADAHTHQLEGFHPEAKIVISLEPHPHFPARLVQNAIVLKLVSSFEGSNLMADSLASSSMRHRLVTAETLRASQLHNAESRTFGAATSIVPQKRHVRISAAVEIVDIAPREVMQSKRAGAPIDVSGSVVLLSTFKGVPGDKFLCVRSAGEPGRYAVGSSCGNVYFLDSLGNSLLQAHAHDAAIWDVAFSSKFSFATGSEDSTASLWSLSTKVENASADAVLIPENSTSLASHVYCVSFLKNTQDSPLLIGGLQNNLAIRSRDSEKVSLVPLPSNAQVVDCLPSYPLALIGGGDGSVTMVDVTRGKAIRSLKEHSQKLPSLSVRDDNQFFTGAFDRVIYSWDTRIPRGVTGTASLDNFGASTAHTLTLKNYVTGIDVDGVHLAASVGENLYLWDVRNLNTVLGGYPQGWKGLSRGLKVHSDSHLIVSASPDGLARFWQFA